MRSIQAKIILLTALSAIVVAGALTVSFQFVLSSSSEAQLDSLKTLLLEDFDRLIKTQVETSATMLGTIAKRRDAGLVSAAEARELARDLLRNMRFGADGYFWADTPEGLNEVLLGNASEGSNRLELKDAKGFPLVKAIIEAGMKGGGYTDYWFPRAGQTEAQPKRGYSLYVPGFNWVIGTGNYIDTIDAIVAEKEAEAEKVRLRAVSVIVPIAALLAIIAVLLAFILGRRLAKPVLLAAARMRKLAEEDADLTVTLSASSKDEIGLLALSFNQFTAKLCSLMVDVKHAIDGTNEIKQNVAASTEETSSAIEEISANLGSIQRQIEVLDININENVAAIEQISRNIGQVDDQIMSQSAMVEESTSAITQMMASLNSVNGIAQAKQATTLALSKVAADSKDNILETANTFKSVVSQIILIQEMADTINGIAAQTNLLSMNAAIEAAHAGDAGRGFAVVAEEIRKLADSAAESSRSIAQLITGITDSVQETDQNMLRTSDAFERISAEVDSTVNAFTEIEQAVSELNIGGKQILDSINEINEITVHIREGSRDIKAGTAAMLDSSGKIKDVSDRVTTGMAEATSGSAEIVRSMQLLVQQSLRLSGIVDELRQKFGRFKTE